MSRPTKAFRWDTGFQSTGDSPTNNLIGADSQSTDIPFEKTTSGEELTSDEKAVSAEARDKYGVGKPTRITIRGSLIN
jgi:hypothetical protein